MSKEQNGLSDGNGHASEAELKAARKREKKLAKLAAASATASASGSTASTPANGEQDGDETATTVMDEVERKRLKKERKREKKRALAEAQEAQTGTTRGAVQDDQVGQDDQSEKKSKKNKNKRKLNDDGAEADGTTAPTTTTTTAEPSPAPAESTVADEQEKPKKRKKNVKGAFGNQIKQGATSSDAAPPLAQESSASSKNATTTTTVPGPSAAELEAFLKQSEVTYEPSGSSSMYPPILSFDSLPVSQGIKAGLKAFAKPTIVQSCSWGVQLRVDASKRARDCVAIAATGSGKTLAFGIPILHHISNLPKSQSHSVAALIVAPTRELAMQTQTNLGEISESLGMGIVCLYGGASKHEQVKLLQKRPRIVVGTPGRLLDLASEGNLDLSNVSWLVLDEADRMLDKGFENDIRNIISQCKASSAGVEGRITSMFSATWPVTVRRLANDFMADPVRITVGSDELSANTSVKQSVIVLQDGREKDRRLLDVLRQEGYAPPGSSRFGGSGPGKRNAGPSSQSESAGAQRDKVLVFALYKKEAARVATWLERQGYSVGCIQGDLSQDKRTAALESFRQGKTGVLVATDVAARGLDIPKVELVVNYTFPLLVEDYVHRIGRTGRAGREGRSVTFFTDAEKHLAGELQRVLRDAGQDVPEALAAFGGTIKKKSHAAYGDHYREIDPNVKAKKITFD